MGVNFNTKRAKCGAKDKRQLLPPPPPRQHTRLREDPPPFPLSLLRTAKIRAAHKFSWAFILIYQGHWQNRWHQDPRQAYAFFRSRHVRRFLKEAPICPFLESCFYDVEKLHHPSLSPSVIFLEPGVVEGTLVARPPP